MPRKFLAGGTSRADHSNNLNGGIIAITEENIAVTRCYKSCDHATMENGELEVDIGGVRRAEHRDAARGVGEMVL